METLTLNNSLTLEVFLNESDHFYDYCTVNGSTTCVFSSECAHNSDYAAYHSNYACRPERCGLEFEGFGTPNTARITDTIYRGECPGESQGSINARFYSTGKSPTPQITLTQVGRDRDVYETVIMQGNIVRVTGGSDI